MDNIQNNSKMEPNLWYSSLCILYDNNKKGKGWTERERERESNRNKGNFVRDQRWKRGCRPSNMESEVDKYVRRLIKFPFCNFFKEDDWQIRIMVEKSSYHY